MSLSPMPSTAASSHDAVPPVSIFIGASSGGVNAILTLAASLPANFPAPIFFVQHIGAHRSQLAELVSARGPNRGITPEDGDRPDPGTIYIAPPDRHMLVEGGVIRLSRGPKEHHARPAIDPLFRSAALDLGPGAVGVVLTGTLDDGSSGLAAIKQCGGIAVVQDPADAFAPGMPRNALAATEADHVVRLDEMPALLSRLAIRTVSRASGTPPEWVRLEQDVMMGRNAVEKLSQIGRPSQFTCPDCGGVMFELAGGRPVRFRCHTGHAFSLESLAYMQEQASDESLWTSLRMLQEKEAILRRLAGQAGHEDAVQEADEIAQAAATLRKLTLRTPMPRGFG